MSSSSMKIENNYDNEYHAILSCYFVSFIINILHDNLGVLACIVTI